MILQSISDHILYTTNLTVLDATLITSHRENKEHTAPTYKRGFHPLAAFVDHSPGCTREPLSMLLRPGNAGSNTAADHVAVTKAALAQLPRGHRSGPKTLIHTDSADGTHDYLNSLGKRSQALAYSVGFGFIKAMVSALENIDPGHWVGAHNSDGTEHDGAWMSEMTDFVDLLSWPKGMRVSAVKSTRRRARGCGSPMFKGCATPLPRPTNATATSPLLRSVTTDVPGARTGSGSAKTQDLKTYHWLHLWPMKSGSTWSCSPRS